VSAKGPFVLAKGTLDLQDNVMLITDENEINQFPFKSQAAFKIGKITYLQASSA